MTIHTPQIIWLVLLGFGLATGLMKHGEKRTGHHNFWLDLIAIILQTSLIYWGGFFG